MRDVARERTEGLMGGITLAIHDKTERRERQWAQGKAGEMHEVERRVRWSMV
jgi:hypothetical protein